MYVWWKEKKTVFLYNEKKKNFLWESTYIKTDWETILLRHHVELRWRLKIFSSLGFEFYFIKVRFLFFVLKFKVICYLMNEVYPCLLLSLCVLYEMQNQIFQQLVLERLQYHACITCDWVFRIKENSFLDDLIFCSKIFYILVARVVWYRYMLGFINLLLNELIEHVSIYFVWDSEKRIIWNRFCFLHFAPTFILD